MNKSKNKMPEFKDEEDEFEFWSSHDSTEFFSETKELQEKLELNKRKSTKQTSA